MRKDIEACSLQTSIRYGEAEAPPVLVFLAQSGEFELGLPGGARPRFSASSPADVHTLRAFLEALLGSSKDLRRATAFIDTHAQLSY